MKTYSFFAIASLFFLCNSFSAHSQRLAYWKGGAPGHTSDWNCPKNWSTGAVPDGFYDVIVPDVSFGSANYPVIEKRSLEVNSLTLQSGASVSIRKKGTLTVHTTLATFGTGALEVEGCLRLTEMIYANCILQGKERHPAHSERNIGYHPPTKPEAFGK